MLCARGWKIFTFLLICTIIIISFSSLTYSSNSNGSNLNSNTVRIGDLEVTVSTDKAEYEINEPINMTVTARNVGEENIPLTFTSGQRCDFIVLKDNVEIWRWSQNKRFTANVMTHWLKPNETLTYSEICSEIWELKNISPGDYQLVGALATDKPKYRYKATVQFKIKDVSLTPVIIIGIAVSIVAVPSCILSYIYYRKRTNNKNSNSIKKISIHNNEEDKN